MRRQRWAVVFASTLLLLLDSTSASHAQGVMEWWCEKLSLSCKDIFKFMSSRAPGDFGKVVVVYNPRSHTRIRLPCGRCRAPLALRERAIAVITPDGISVLSIPHGEVLRTHAISGLVDLVAEVGHEARLAVTVEVGKEYCPEPAVYEPSRDHLTRSGLQEPSGLCTSPPAIKRVKDGIELYLRGSTGNEEVFARPLNARKAFRIVDRPADDETEWFDPVWFGEEIVYVAK